MAQTAAILPGEEGQTATTASRLKRRIARHWLLFVNSVSATFAILSLLAPYLAAHGENAIARWIYYAFSLICHQRIDRSFALFHEKMADCERCAAIYAGVFLFGLLYAALRTRIRQLPFWIFMLLTVPIALDGFTQEFGLRESNWELRVVTGALFALGFTWLIFPRMEVGFARLRAELERRHHPASTGQAPSR
ncbi:DUF2085 domain-containing protein [Nitrolancea hollandica]|uniref:Membrane protein-like protein n=1 Tax=Nitrolancea hollandica Lb TaxID=1129897 RepID=I4EER7_9BACT|nr:DUF2085 domain-containing protein [Nitrolancea hollandica]CCF83179.1 Membrane protein-like protein [Nitrolancea hollandica Lb]